MNARAPFFLTQWVARRMIDEGVRGCVVNIASIAGTAGSSTTDYGGTKAAVINLTRSLAKPLGRHGIRVNAVSPGTVNTALGERVPKELRERLVQGTALGRAAEPDEIASVVEFLASENAGYITGANVDVNGGM
ncbi:MAG TPA: SDR family oxidoreductase [Ramlibacter sp.]|nr:SDR family oxidoreductase [Ramlibacter sp.]